MPLKLKLEVALAQLAALMRELGQIPVEVRVEDVRLQLDHDPALGRRAHADDGADWSPRQHDMRFLVWRPAMPHLRKTTGRAGESRFSSNGGGDTSQAAKLKRLETETRARQTAEARRRLLAPDAAEPGPPAKPKSRLQGRPFQSGHRPLRSRNTLERRS